MTADILFDPLLPVWVLVLLAIALSLVAAFAAWRGLRGWGLRWSAGMVILLALAAPALRQEDRRPLSDIAIMLVDQSASQALSDRSEQTAAAAEALEAALSARPDTELRRVDVGDGPDNSGTRLIAALQDVLAEVPRARISGIFVLSDGRAHDLDQLNDLAEELPAPLHVLESGRATDWDRRLIVENAPAFGILGEPVVLSLRIEDQGAVPTENGAVELSLSVDGAEPFLVSVPIGQTFDVPVTLQHGGRNVIHFTIPEAEGELTARNNEAIVQMNGVRDRLRVLLVSGEPHAGGRTWRNLLKSDSSVDLVHFTILRPPEKQDGIPVGELSLIAFPTRELFLEKVDDFDLIIFDRYKRRGILPSVYLDNVRRYVRDGGAVLVAAGPDFASADSLFRSPLGVILPAQPTARVLEQGFQPKVTDLGARHPVTTGLPQANTFGSELLPPEWGRWMRQVQLVPESGSVVMTGVEDEPLLILDRVENGRVALLASDQAWLWDRGFEGGGPQAELLRRLAHWMMQEPELEEEALTANVIDQQLRIERRTLAETVEPLRLIGPNGEEEVLEMSPSEPGRYVINHAVQALGLYRLQQGNLETVIGVGPMAPREFEDTIASGTPLQQAIADLRGRPAGGIWRMEEGQPRLRDVRAGRPLAGRDWLGLTPRDASEALAVTRQPLLPAWVVMLLVLGLSAGAWLCEGRR